MKDPTKPKRAATPYIAFVTEQRPTVQQSNPEMKPTVLMKELGRIWQSYSDTEKAPFVAIANRDRMRHEVETKAWQAKNEGAGVDASSSKDTTVATIDEKQAKKVRYAALCACPAALARALPHKLSS